MTVHNTDAHTSRRFARWAPTAALFALFYVYVWLIVRPALLYHYQCPVFMTGKEFLSRFTPWSGGLAEYASLFLAQFYCYPPIGAAVATLTTWMICAMAAAVFSSRDTRVHAAVALVPALLLLALFQRYSFHLITSVGLIVALGAAWVWVKLPLRSTLLRLAIFAVSAGGIFYLAGGMVVLFGVMCGLFELLHRRSIVGALVCVLLAAALPVGYGLYSYEMSIVEALKPLVPFRWRSVAFSGYLSLPSGDTWGPLEWSGGLHWALMAWFPVGMIMAAALRRRARRFGSGTAGTESQAGMPDLLSRGAGCRWTAKSFVAFLVVAAALLIASADGGRKRRILVDYCGAQREWDAVLKTARKLDGEDFDRFVMHEVNRALYYTGRLPEDMFKYPQRLDEDSLLLAGEDSQQLFASYYKAGRIFLELGQVNFAEEYTQMALEALGERPYILKQLVRINVLQKRPTVTRVLLRILERNMLCRDWARSFRESLDDDPSASWDPVVKRAREFMPTRHDPENDPAPRGPVLPEDVLLGLMKTNWENRMAFEYLMGLHLLSRVPGKIAAGISIMKEMDAWKTEGIPRLYEEALLVFLNDPKYRERRFLDNPESRQMMMIARSFNRSISDPSRVRMKQFKKRHKEYLRASGEAKRRAFTRLVEEDGGSYFFYYAFGFSADKVSQLPPDVMENLP